MKSKNILASFKYALEGIYTAFMSERNLKIHLVCTIIVLLLALYLKFSILEFVLLLLIIASVIGAELFNTAIEEVVNILSPEKRKEAKKAKDIAAGAVLIFAFFAFINGLILFAYKVLH